MQWEFQHSCKGVDLEQPPITADNVKGNFFLATVSDKMFAIASSTYHTLKNPWSAMMLLSQMPLLHLIFMPFSTILKLVKKFFPFHENMLVVLSLSRITASPPSGFLLILLCNVICA